MEQRRQQYQPVVRRPAQSPRDRGQQHLVKVEFEGSAVEQKTKCQAELAAHADAAQPVGGASAAGAGHQSNAKGTTRRQRKKLNKQRAAIAVEQV